MASGKTEYSKGELIFSSIMLLIIVVTVSVGLSRRESNSKPVSEHSAGKAIVACEQYAKSIATHPSTVDFSLFLDVNKKKIGSDKWRITSSFTAKNSFNLEARYYIQCDVYRGVVVDASVQEA